MPGILPMKVIKVGTNAQSRIAQACDRCRSKKIRCDGIRPCCSQCANVGFECKTSDKLSRRAFPRGYTESLEERVRNLESEVRELKDLLDEKDEKIDILSKMHSHSKPSVISSLSRESPKENKEDIFRVQASPLLFDSESSDAYFMGASSGRAFVDAFKRKIQESGKSCAEFNTDGFLNLHDEVLEDSILTVPDTSPAPPRIFTDRMVNVFFQEWAPLFPILHKPSFLRVYEQFVDDPEQMAEKHKLAQLYLVFGIAAISAEIPDREQLIICEVRWRTALDALMMDNTLMTLQCLILAQLFCMAKGDYKRLQHYKAIAVGLSHRLGLHQSQKRFSFGALTIETRKRVFWSLYTVDCFSAASLGLPKLLMEADVYAEYPTDIDDEYVMEKGFQPTLPGEYTKISSALALFKVSRILSKVLEKNYPAAASHDLSFVSIQALETELKDWSANLPNHLKLTFIQDKPSTDVTGNRSPLLSLAFYYIRTLIHRPVIGSCPSKKSSSSVMALADSSKHIIQITQLLNERHLAFSLCLNKDELMTLCGLSLLYQRLDLKQDGKLMKDGQELVQEVMKSLAKSDANGASDFTKLASSMGIKDPMNSRTEAESVIVSSVAPDFTPSAATASNHVDLTSDVTHVQQQRRATVSTRTMPQMDNVSPSELSNRVLVSPFPENSAPALVQHQYQQATSWPSTSPKPQPKATRARTKNTNLDYLSLSSSDPPSPILLRAPFPKHYKKGNSNTTANFRPSNSSNSVSRHQQDRSSSVHSSSWENILGSVDEAQIYDAMYGGTPLPLSLTTSSGSGSRNLCSSSVSSALTGISNSSSEKYPSSTSTDKSTDSSDWRITGADLDVSADVDGSGGWDVASLTLHHGYPSSNSSGLSGGGAGDRGKSLDLENGGVGECHSVLSFSGEESLSSSGEEFGGDGYGGMENGNGGIEEGGGGGGGGGDSCDSSLMDYQHIMLAGNGETWFE